MKNIFQLFLVWLGLHLHIITLAQQPNILLYIIDDVGVDPIPNYLPNAEKANMPRLESLMEAGITFDNVWSNPLCSPSRSAILTGKYGFRTNVLDAEAYSQLSTEETTLHDYINQVSGGTYRTSLIGKWHLSGLGNQNKDYPADCGIPYYAGNLGGGVADYYHWSLTINGQSSLSLDYLTPKYTDLAIEWINDQTQPWFCWVAHNAAHTPFHLPPDYMHSQGDLPTDSASIAANPLPYFLAMVESSDYELGRLLDNIPQNILDNTVIIVIGDNGTQRNVLQSPYAQNQGKSSLYQGGIHVPMVIAGAGVSRHDEREAALISFTDLFSTIVELTGTTLPEIYDSKSFYPLLTQALPGIRDCAYSEITESLISPAGWTTRDATYKLIHYYNGNEEFYNLIDDPYESNDLLEGSLTATEQAAFDNLVACNPQNTDSSFDVTAENGFEIFPNPAGSDVFVFLNTTLSQKYLITDIKGNPVKSGFLTLGQNQLPITGLPPGLYLIQVGDRVKKFVKQ